VKIFFRWCYFSWRLTSTH